MGKLKKKALVATSLSAMMIFSSTGFSSIAHAAVDENNITSITDYKSDIMGDKDSFKSGFTISPDINTNSSEIVSVIVELKEEPLAIAKAKDQKSSDLKIKQEHESFKNSITTVVKPKNDNDSQVKVKIGNEFFNVFNGITMSIPANKLPEIAKMPQVKTIWNNKEVKLPESNMIDPKAGPKDGIIQIGADRLHDENINGEGIKVGVLDTGIDHNHPELKGVYKGGYDFVNNDDDPMETTYKDWKAANASQGYPEIIQGSSYYTSHGTHVSGTIAAGGEESKAKGVAPNVDLHAYKVLGPYGSGQTAWILAGIDKAVQDGMDVINLSLGASVNDPLSPTSVAINNAAKAGVIPVVAAGNSGPNESTLGSPGTSPLAITVGASDTNLTIPIFEGSIQSNNINIKLLANSYDFDLDSLKAQSFEMVNCGLGKVDDFANKDLTGKIAVIQRGELSLNEKIANAKQAGAKLVFIYNNVEGHINAYLEEGYNYIPTFNLTKADGEALINNIESNKTFTFNSITSEIQQGDKLADFSSRGPVGLTSEIKPDVVAPGVNIYSTYPEFINDKEDGEDYSKAYAKISGTSMATPHVTGVVALMLDDAQKHGEKMSVEDVKTALMNNAEKLNGDYSVYEKGAGRVNAYNSVKDDISIKINNKTKTIENNEVVEVDNITGSLQFGNIYHGEENKERTIQITNDSDTEKEFKVSIINSTAKGNIKDSLKNGVKLDGLPDTIKVPAKSTIDIKTAMNIPQSAEQGFYEGTVVITNTKDDKEDYLIPYAVRYSEKGIKNFNLTRNSISDDRDYYDVSFNPALGYIVSYNNPIKSQKLFLKDAQTGKRIGIIQDFKNMAIIPDTSYFVFPAFGGKYIPMVGEYVENRLAIAKEGHYKLELEAKDIDGNIYTSEQDLFIDNTPPEMIFEDNKKPGVHEVSESDYTVEDGNKAYYVKGKLYDDTIEKLKKLGYTHDVFGYELTQQANHMDYRQHLPNERLPWSTGTMNIDKQGSFNMGVLPEEIKTNPTEVSLFAHDSATAGDFNKEKFFNFVKEGEAYGDIAYDKEKVSKGDTQTAHINFKNMKDATKLEFVIGFDKNPYDLEDITINPEFKKYVESKGLHVELKHEPTDDSNIEKQGGEAHKVIVEISGGIDINDKMPVIDIKADVVDGVNENRYMYQNRFYTETNSKNKYTDKNGNEKQLYIMSYANSFKFIPRTTISDFYYISSQGFFDENGWSKKLDYTKMGAKAYVITPDGKRYDGEIDSKGFVECKVPTSIEDGEFYVEVPGHFKNKVKVELGEYFEGDVVGVGRVDRILTAYAGDMNGDNIIDDKDKEILKSDIGKTTTSEQNYLASDINKDRVVDNKDLEYINKNFGMINPRLMEDAEVAMATVLEEKNIYNLIIALEKVKLLPNCKQKEEFTAKLDKLSDELRLDKEIKTITKAVEKAEKSRQKKHVDEARELVNKLPKCAIRDELNKRLDEINVKQK